MKFDLFVLCLWDPQKDYELRIGKNFLLGRYFEGWGRGVEKCPTLASPV